MSETTAEGARAAGDHARVLQPDGVGDRSRPPVADERVAVCDTERRLIDFACASSDWFWEMDADLRFTWFSAETETSLDVEREHFLGRSRWDIATDLGQTEKWNRHRDDLLARRPFRDFRYRTRTRDGDDIYISVSGVPVFAPDGVFCGYRGSGRNVTAETLAEQKAEQAQLRLQDAVESITHGFALFDADDCLVLCNENYRRALAGVGDILKPGVPFEHLARALVSCGYVSMPENQRENWLAERLRARTHGPGARIYEATDGSWIEVREYATRDGGRAVIRVDVSQQKRVEEALRRSEARLADAQRLAGLGSWEITISANAMTWSEELWRILGLESTVVSANYDSFLDAVHPEDRASVARAIDAAVHKSAPYKLEHRVVRPCGEIRYVVQEGEVHFDEAEVPVTMLGTMQDVTGRRAAERRMHEIEERFRIAFETSADALCISRLHDGLLINVNDAFVKLYGHPKEQLIGRTSVDTGIWRDLRSRESFLNQILEEGSVRNLVTHNRRQDGRSLTVLISASLCMLNGSPHLVTSIRDITEFERVEAELRKLWQAVEQSSAAVIITDGDGRIDYVNASFSAVTGYSREEVCGQLPSILKSGRTSEDEYRALWKTITRGADWHGEFCNRRKDGSHYWASASISPVKGGDGTITNFIGIQADISQRKQAEEELRASEERYRSLIETSLFGICIEQDGRAVFVNQTFADIFGYASTAEIISLVSLRELYSPEDQARAAQYQMMHGDPCSSQYEMRGIRKDGTIIWLHTHTKAIPWNGGLAIQSMVVDITLRKLYEDRLVFQANYDPVTELPNRMMALDRLTTAIVSARRRRTKVAVLFIDVDHFKKVNDTLGHDVGDQFLRQVGQRLRDAVREEDIVARLGGDEFIVVLPDIRKRSDAAGVASKIGATMARPFLLDGQEAFVTVSIGVAVCPDDGEDADGLMRHADAAMYLAKDEGRGTSRFFSAKLRERDHNRIRLEAALRHALDRGQLSLYYQPLVDIASGRIIGAEALLRWFSPEFGQINPDQFIRLAEDTGLIVPIGAWVLTTGCREMKRWRDAGFESIGLSVNVSSRQFRGTSLIQAVSDALALNDLRPQQLELEITESLLMDHLGDIRSTIGRLQRCGVRLAVDDFGTGYSSLSYLNRFPLDTLKIDRSFTRGMLTDAGQATLVDALIVLAHRLELRVIAEGVETPEQLEFLRARGCDVAQGYLFSPPLPADSFLELLAQDRQQPERRAAG